MAPRSICFQATFPLTLPSCFTGAIQQEEGNAKSRRQVARNSLDSVLISPSLDIFTAGAVTLLNQPSLPNSDNIDEVYTKKLPWSLISSVYELKFICLFNFSSFTSRKR